VTPKQFFLAGVLACLSVAPIAARAADVTVQIRLASPDALELTFELPPACRQLQFLNRSDAYRKIRASWQPLDACASADGNALTRLDPACRQLRFRVPVSADKVTGYPGAFPVGEGVYVHTSKYALADTCGAVGYRFQAAGSVGADAAFHHAQWLVDAPAGASMPALLLPMDVPDAPGTPAYFDPRLSAQAVAQIRQVADDTVAFYRRELPDAPFKMPILAATLAQQPGGPNIGADAGDVLRLAFFNWPQQPGPEERRSMTFLVAHEFSHRFQLRDAVDGYPDARLIHEGGAEFLRWMVSIDKGWLSHAQAAAELDDALASCMMDVGPQAWRDLSARTIASTMADYHCGLAVYVYGLAARQGGGSALARFGEFYRQLRLGGTPDFANTLECGADAHCQAHWLPALLGSSAMQPAWTELISGNRLGRLAPPTQPQRDAMMRRALEQLVRGDCAGASSTTPTRDSMLVDGLKQCATLQRDLVVTQVEGVAVWGTPSALPAMGAACASRGAVRLGTRDGQSVTVACRQPYQASTQFFAADIERILAALARR
jgi:hypothetical protein